jgi:hypothetical protein
MSAEDAHKLIVIGQELAKASVALGVHAGALHDDVAAVDPALLRTHATLVAALAGRIDAVADELEARP